MGSVPVQSNPISPEKEAAIRSRLADILASPEFRASQKCQSFLKYVVEEALAGRQEALKERVIGADVFGRAPGFETAGDSIVRVKATEVRRRLARYYQGQPGPGVRIELPTGSYVPVFPIEDGVLVVATVAPAAVVAEGPLLSRRAMWGAGGVGAVAVAAVAVWRQRAAVTALDRFWGPLLGTAAPGGVCASGGPAISARTTEVLDALRRPVVARVFGSEDFQLSRQAQTSWPTAQAIADVSRMLGTAGKDFELRVADQMSFEQVKTHPIVVIGMFSNPWTIELTRHLRFSFAPTADGQYVVRDATRSEPLRRVAGLYPNTPMPLDYALVTRLLDPQQDRRLVAMGGISGLGTRVAADFATSARHWEQFARMAPAGWENKNLQVLLETRIVGDTPNPPTIIAFHVW